MAILSRPSRASFSGLSQNVSPPTVKLLPMIPGSKNTSGLVSSCRLTSSTSPSPRFAGSTAPLATNALSSNQSLRLLGNGRLRYLTVSRK
ncbi:hypothetical protein D3C84_761920 [compost metagenome]